MKTRSPRLLLALAGVCLSAGAFGQSPSEFFLPDDTHIVLFTSGGTFTLSNEQGVSWQPVVEQEKAFETWRKKLVGKPETSSLVKDLLGKNKKNAMKKLGGLRVKPPGADPVQATFTFTNGKPDVPVTLKASGATKDWNPAPDAPLSDVATGLGLRSRDQLEPSLRTAGDGGKPWTHIVRLLQNSPTSYLPVGRSGVLVVERDEAPAPAPDKNQSPTTTAVKPPKTETGGSQTALLVGVFAVIIVVGGAGAFFFVRRSQGSGGTPIVDGQKSVKINAEEYKLLQFFQGEANRRLTSTADAADREESLQLILTRFRGYPDLERQVTALKQSVEHLNEQVRLLTYYKNYSEQADSFLKQHEKLQSELAAAQSQLASLGAAGKQLEQEKTTLSREKAELERSLKAAKAELASTDELFGQQVDALDALAADLARLKERIEL